MNTRTIAEHDVIVIGGGLSGRLPLLLHHQGPNFLKFHFYPCDEV